VGGEALGVGVVGEGDGGRCEVSGRWDCRAKILRGRFPMQRRVCMLEVKLLVGRIGMQPMHHLIRHADAHDALLKHKSHIYHCRSIAMN
jgi:hypothetical protein